MGRCVNVNESVARDEKEMWAANCLPQNFHGSLGEATKIQKTCAPQLVHGVMPPASAGSTKASAPQPSSAASGSSGAAHAHASAAGAASPKKARTLAEVHAALYTLQGWTAAFFAAQCALVLARRVGLLPAAVQVSLPSLDMGRKKG